MTCLTKRQQPSLLGHFLQLLRTATIERMVLPDINGMEMDERILLESNLANSRPNPERPVAGRQNGKG